MTSFRDEIVLALKRGATFLELREIVLRHKAGGLGQRAAYETLQGIWVELGCNKDEADDNPFCERLGDLMDQVWGYCPRAKAIWESALSEVQE